MFFPNGRDLDLEWSGRLEGLEGLEGRKGKGLMAHGFRPQTGLDPRYIRSALFHANWSRPLGQARALKC